MHRLTAASLRLGQDQLTANAAAAILMMQYPGGSNPPSLQKNWLVCRRLTPHALALRAVKEMPKTEAMDALLNQCAIFLSTQDNLAGAIECYEVSLALKQARLGEEHRDVSVALGNLAQKLAETDRRVEALLMIARVIALDEEHRPDSGDLASRYMQAASVHIELARAGDASQYKQALDWIAQAKPIRAKLFGENSEAMAHCLAQEGHVNAAMGDLAGAIDTNKQALSILKTGDKADLATSLNNLAGCYLLAGDPDRATSHFRESYGIRKDIYAENSSHSWLNATAVWFATALLVQARAGQNLPQRKMEAKTICNDHGLDFAQIEADAQIFPLTPIIDLPD